MGSHQWKYDVFVSFRGKDVRNNFIAHLFRELKREGINHFSDTDEEDAGEKINEKLPRAIRHSRFALIVFTPNYADSKSCLNELVEILECRRQLQNHGYVAISIFHGVSTGDISKLTRGSEFARGFQRLSARTKGDKAQLKKWKEALVEATQISGLSLKNHAGGNEATLIEKIVRCLRKKIHLTWPLSSNKNAIRVDHLTDDVIPLRRNGKIGEASRSDLHGLQDRSLQVTPSHSKIVFMVKIHYPNEYPISISGHMRDNQQAPYNVRPLKLHINRKPYGPFGRENGEISHAFPFEIWDERKNKDARQMVVGFDSAIKSVSILYDNFGRPVVDFSHGTTGGGKTYWIKLDYLNENLSSALGFHGSCNIPPFKSIRAHSEHIPHTHPLKVLGPFGVNSGDPWDDGRHIDIQRILVRYDESFIHSIAFDYVDNSGSVRSIRHGGSGGEETFEIKIDDADEYLTLISGYIRGGITSLTFQTNKRTIGPIGEEIGRHFSSPATGGKVVGFYGRSGRHLEAIGAYFEPIPHLYLIKSIGPFGDLRGRAFDDRKYDGVKQIQKMHDDVIRYVMFVYDNGGEQVCSDIYGGHKEYDKAGVTVIRLDYPWEYLTSISGYIQERGGDGIEGAIVQSLTFYTNRWTHGPFGKERGKYFSHPSTRSKIIGFYGRYGETLNAIGVYAKSIQEPYPFRTIRPFGGSGGAPWDDGVHTHARGSYVITGDMIPSDGIVNVDSGFAIGFPQPSEKGGSAGVSISPYLNPLLSLSSVWKSFVEFCVNMHACCFCCNND